jgi:general secretion pathway protein H
MFYQIRLRRPNRSTGFTLIELLVVIAVLALMTSAAAFIAHAPGGPELRSTTLALVGDLRGLREEAMRRQTVAMLSFDSSIGSYTLQPDAETRRLPTNLAAKTIAGEPGFFGDAPDTISFFPDGSSTGGVITLSRKDLSVTIRIEPLDGQITVEG